MPSEYTKAEADLMGRLLRGEKKKRHPLAVAVKLVSKEVAKWTEPEGHLVLTEHGLAEARAMWSGVAEGEHQQPVAVAEVAPARQIAFDLPGVPIDLPTRGVREALALVLGGTQEDDAVAKVLLAHYPDGRGLATASARALSSLGLRVTQANAIRAAFALGRACRRAQSQTFLGAPVTGPEHVVRAIWGDGDVPSLEVERMWVASLNAAGRLIDVSCVSQGGAATAAVEMRDILVPAVRCRAVGMYLVHNHPSGDLRWSHSDVRLTQRAMASARAIQIEFIDHLIIAPSGDWVSFEEARL